jgi:hypothetical protein
MTTVAEQEQAQAAPFEGAGFAHTALGFIKRFV